MMISLVTAQYFISDDLKEKAQSCDYKLQLEGLLLGVKQHYKALSCLCSSIKSVGA